MRIISLVPSLTELLFDLSIGDKVVGITNFCIHPKNQLKGIPKIGGTKTLNIDKILNLQPDLIIANKEENSKDQIELLSKKFKVWITDIITVEDALDFILELGLKTNSILKAEEIISQIKLGLNSIPPALTDKKVVYFIWDSPMMVAGKQTFINSMLKEINLINAYSSNSSRYPEVTADEIQLLNPEYILLSSEPFPFKEIHRELYEAKFPNSKIILVDGEMFSWYGSRMILASKYFKTLLKSMQ